LVAPGVGRQGALTPALRYAQDHARGAPAADSEGLARNVDAVMRQPADDVGDPVRLE
jgi:hypothetical protein